MAEQAQFGFLFEDERMKDYRDFIGVNEPPSNEIAEEVASPPEVIQEQPTHKELERDGQLALIDVGEWWEEHWKGMPEFVQKDLTSFHVIYVHFENRDDMDAFSKLIGQKIGLNTKSIWYPEAEITALTTRMRYVEERPKISEGIDVIDAE